MEKKLSDNAKSIMTMVGGVLIACAIIDEITENIVPQMERLQSGDVMQELKALPAAKEKEDDLESKEKSERDEEREKEREAERKSHQDEVAELKRRLEELESKPEEQKNEG